MTTELLYLIAAIVLGLVHVEATGQVGVMQHGMKYGLGPRDVEKPVTGWGGRLVRAFSNYMQTFPFFAAAVLIAQVTGRHDGWTAWGSGLYFWARLAYVPLYVTGVPVVRTLAFLAGVVGIAFILVGVA